LKRKLHKLIYLYFIFVFYQLLSEKPGRSLSNFCWFIIFKNIVQFVGLFRRKAYKITESSLQSYILWKRNVYMQGHHTMILIHEIETLCKLSCKIFKYRSCQFQSIKI